MQATRDRSAVHAALLASAAAWTSVPPLLSRADELGYEQLASTDGLLEDTWTRVRVYLFASDAGRVPDASNSSRSRSRIADDPLKIAALRVFCDAVSLLSASRGYHWDEDASFWRDVFAALRAKHVIMHRLDRWGTRDVVPRDGVDAREDDERASQKPRIALDFGQESVTIEKLECMLAFLRMKTADVLVEAGDALRGALRACSASILGPQPRVREIEVELSLDWSCMTVALLGRLHETLEAYASCADSDTSEANEDDTVAAVQYVITGLDLRGNHLTTARHFAILTDIVQLDASSVRLRTLNLDGTFLPVLPLECFSALQLFLASTIRVGGSQLEVLRLGSAAMDVDIVASVMSALRHSTRLRHVQLGQENLELRWKVDYNFPAAWAWVAFALFHPSSTSSVRVIDLRYLSIPDDVLPAVTAVMTSPHPALTLMLLQSPHIQAFIDREPDHVAPAAGTLFVRVRNATKPRVAPNTTAPKLPAATGGDDSLLEVVVQLAKSTCVIVPGCGFGWVSPSAIVSSESRAAPTHRSRTVDTLLWSPLESHSSSPLIPLLSMLGRDLRGLIIPFSHATNDDLQQIADACPQLERLELPVHHLTALGDLGTKLPRLHTLNVQQFRLHALLEVEELNFVADVARMLTTPLGQRLKRLAFSFKRSDVVAMRSIVAQLAMNRTLRLIQVNPSTFGHDDFVPQLRKLQGDCVGVGARCRPALKLAFLSVLKHRECAIEAMHSLDALALSQIFAFAAKPIERHVVLRVPREYDMVTPLQPGAEITVYNPPPRQN